MAQSHLELVSRTLKVTQILAGAFTIVQISIVLAIS